MKNKNELSLCEDREEIDSIYSELDHSMAIKQKKLVAIPNTTCSICQKTNE